MLLNETIFVPLIIDGKDVHLSNNDHTFTPDSLHAKSHRTLQVLAQGADTACCHATVDSCARAFDTWRATSTAERRRLLLRLAQLFREKEQEARDLLADEIYATPLWATINIEDTFALIHEAAACVTSPILSGTIPPAANSDAQALVFSEPLGVVLGIAPWNAPMILGFRAVLPAIAAGNTAILKGSELSPRIHYFIANLFREAGFPDGVCNFLLHRDVDAAAVFDAIIERHEVRKCNFTGSTPVGRMIASRAARALKPCLMELGGKNYATVLEDADLDKAARLVIEGAFLHNGQICMSTDTVLVMESILPRFRDALYSLLQDPATQDTFISSVVTPKSATRIKALLSDAASKGSKLHIATEPTSNSLHIGATSHKYTAKISPTIIENITPSMDLYTQESFGPLLSLMAVRSEDEAVNIVNECRFGLSAAIFTKDHYRAIFMAKKLRVGAVHVNGATVHDESTLPHGGHGDSGWGRFGAAWGLAEFVQTKTVILNR